MHTDASANDIRGYAASWTTCIRCLLLLVVTLALPLSILQYSGLLDPHLALFNGGKVFVPTEVAAKDTRVKSNESLTVEPVGAHNDLSLRSSDAWRMRDLEEYNKQMEAFRAKAIRDYMSTNNTWCANTLVNTDIGCIWTDDRTTQQRASNFKWKRHSPKCVVRETGPEHPITEQAPCQKVSRDSHTTGFYMVASKFLSDRDVALWIPTAALQTTCNSLPNLVPYIVCLRHKRLVQCPTRCHWSGNDTGSGIMISASGQHVLSMARLPSNYSYFRFADSKDVFECQEGSIEINDVDTYQIKATVLHTECKWNDGRWDDRGSAVRRRRFYPNAEIKLVMSPNPSCPPASTQQPILPTCLGSHAAESAGRWVAQTVVKKSSQWGSHAAEAGESHWRTPDGIFNPVMRRCPGIHEYPKHPPFVWMPWRCRMLLFRFRSITDTNVRTTHQGGVMGKWVKNDLAYLDCFQKYEGNFSNKKVYLLGESHAEFVYSHFMASVRPRITSPIIDYQFTNYCCPLPHMPDVGLVILMIGNWDAAKPFRRPLNETLHCIDKLFMQLSKWQAAGVEVRMGTPLSVRLPYTPPFDIQGSHKWGLPTNKARATWKATQLLGQGLRAAAQKHGVPLWDILQLTTGREENAGGDWCNHYNEQTYYVLLQVLCNSIAPPGFGS